MVLADAVAPSADAEDVATANWAAPIRIRHSKHVVKAVGK
ncbi:uncharacterized protein Dmoj_GI25626 [Drosophila mojavensis]|uniref:Uncharacterized protein n=1 Tax=Drosophila mojavensis TaxID=7230 RepID=A0A0Q9X2A5_DROMO|nr:uncharacterized protein Dmoj_GI25626 [Drosophila mojavensis]